MAFYPFITYKNTVPLTSPSTKTPNQKTINTNLKRTFDRTLQAIPHPLHSAILVGTYLPDRHYRLGKFLQSLSLLWPLLVMTCQLRYPVSPLLIHYNDIIFSLYKGKLDCNFYFVILFFFFWTSTGWLVNGVFIFRVFINRWYLYIVLDFRKKFCTLFMEWLVGISVFYCER